MVFFFRASQVVILMYVMTQLYMLLVEMEHSSLVLM